MNDTAKKIRTIVCLGILVAVSATVCGRWVLRARPMLDESTVVRRCYVSPWENDTYEARFYSTDWPAFGRWVWRGVFAVTGWRWEEFDNEHYVFQKDRPLFPGNIDILNGELAPRGPVYVLRGVAAAFVVMTCVVIFWLGRMVTGSDAAGLVAPAGILLHPAMGQWLIGYPGTDAMILFWMVAFLALWVKLHLAGKALTVRQVMLMAVVAGLAAGTKINGGLLTVAFAGYLAAHGRGWSRWWMPAVFGAAAFVVFVALNPVLWQPGGGGVVAGIREILARRLDVMKDQEQLRPMARFAYFETRARLLPLLPWAGFVFYMRRRDKWLAPAAWWAVAVFAGSYAALNRYDARLGFPLDAAVIVPTTLATLCVLVEALRRRGAAREQQGAGDE